MFNNLDICRICGTNGHMVQKCKCIKAVLPCTQTSAFSHGHSCRHQFPYHRGVGMIIVFYMDPAETNQCLGRCSRSSVFWTSPKPPWARIGCNWPLHVQMAHCNPHRQWVCRHATNPKNYRNYNTSLDCFWQFLSMGFLRYLTTTHSLLYIVTLYIMYVLEIPK